jgi:lysophospholipase L1-like esterase
MPSIIMPYVVSGIKFILLSVLSFILFDNTGDSKDNFVLNKGIPGNNVANLLKRLERAVLNHQPSLVIIQIGTNDMVNPRKMLPYLAYSDQLNILVDRIRSSGAEVLLLSLPYVDTAYLFDRYGRENYTSGPNEKIDSANSIIHSIATAQHCLYFDMNEVFRLYNSPGREASSLIRNERNTGVKDGVHPTPHGYHVMAESIFNYLQREGRSYHKIICFGDSITFGAFALGQGTNKGKTYPAVLRKLLAAR